MGLGIGCGVGWGPGFGPEVIGYVGAGCGVGFSVGFTFAGVGVGLPANHLIQAPYNAVEATRHNVLAVAPFVVGLHREASGRLDSFGKKLQADKGLLLGSLDLNSMRDQWSIHSRSFSRALETCTSRLLPPRKGSDD
ncbi:unnamed protein product [Linum tenue]|uniref:Cadmium-induced protein AS8 n=1 Tax=Linum tenue TaxID=586396 RepID=A0AAV0RPD1_9ROSI|nr:unnamed protein product [Linum tenue]